MKEQKKFKKIIKRNHAEADIKNLIFNSILIIISSILILINDYMITKLILVTAIIINVTYFFIMLMDTEVYWEEVKG